MDCGWKPEIVDMYERMGAGLPPNGVVLAELRARRSAGATHLQGDHQITIEERPDLRLELSNIATRCDRCHARKTAREDGGFGRSSGTSAQLSDF